jgi:hypothetical protein
MQLLSSSIEVINFIYTSLQGTSELSLNESTLQSAYEAFDKIIGLFTACSAGQITDSDGNVSLYNITGWADTANVKDVLIFGKLNVYRMLLEDSTFPLSVSPIVQAGILSIPKDTKEVKLISVHKSVANNVIRYEYDELISLVIQNAMQIDSTYYNPNTLNLHIYVGDTATLRITQQSTYFIDTKTKNTTRHIYPPTTHGYGTTLMPMEGNKVIENILGSFVTPYRSQQHNNQLFYDVL